MHLSIQTITKDSFSPFGTVLEMDPEDQREFQVLIREPGSPWRLAMLRCTWHCIDTIECHPTSYETFEPLSGVTILVTALQDSPGEFHAFLLDRPVCLHKNIWHQVMALSQESQIKLTENLSVSDTRRIPCKPITCRVTDADE